MRAKDPERAAELVRIVKSLPPPPGSLFYVLDRTTPIPCEHGIAAEWFMVADRRVAEDLLSTGERVSTVFLGRDYQWQLGLPSLLFETMIFGGKYDSAQWRYHTYDEAVAGHQRALALLSPAATDNPLIVEKAHERNL